MRRDMLNLRVLLGIMALTGWLLFFAGGLLIDTFEYRRFLAPRAFANEIEGDATIAGKAPLTYRGSTSFAFLAAVLCFTPTNLVLVTLLAGLLGGCASNIVVQSLDADARQQIHSRRLMYLEETPWSAMMRSFIVYLCVLAGLYFAMDDPFKDSTPAQYMRLAGTLSLTAFVVGYDPSRIEQWLRLVPSPQPSQVVTIRDSGEQIEMTAAQGPITSSAEPLDNSHNASAILVNAHQFEDRAATSLSTGKKRNAK